MTMGKKHVKHRKALRLGATTLALCLSLSAAGTIASGTQVQAAGDIEIHGPRISKPGETEPLNPGMVVGVRAGGNYNEFNSLAEGFKMAAHKSKVVIKLFRDTEVSDMIWGAGDMKEATLDLNGHTIRRAGASRSSNGGIIGLESGSELSIISTGGQGSFQNASSSDDGGCFSVKEGARLTADGIRIEHTGTSGCGGALYNDGGYVDLRAVSISECSASKDGGAIYHNKGQMYIRECTITDNRSEKDGGGIAIAGENVEIYNSQILRNFASGDGGGVWVNDNKVFLVGGEIKANMADYGGGVYVDSKRDINIQGKLIIEENKTTSNDESNLVLQDGIASSARAYDGGLLPGSRIGINKTKGLNSGYKAVIGATDYELNNGYFFSDRGKLELRDTSQKEEVFMATAVDSYGWGIALLIVLELVGAGYVIHLVRKRRLKAK